MKYLLTPLFFFYAITLFAQHPEHPDWAPNLVPNPGFERVKPIIDPKTDVYLQFRHFMKEWSSPTKSTPDLIDKTLKLDDVVIENSKPALPRTGDRCIALITDNPGVSESKTGTYREYVQAKLKSPLIPGEEYMLEFWVKKAYKAKIVSNNMGVILTLDKVGRTDFEPILTEPLFNHKKVMENDEEWLKIGGKFTAKEALQYIMIGNFFDKPGTVVKKIREDGFNSAYYLIDDVNLYQLTNIQPKKPIVETVENVKVEIGKRIRLRNILFETGKWDLLPESNRELDLLVKLMNEHPSMEIAIQGHTDSDGSEKFNQKLSQNRAKAVFRYLITKGISKNNLTFEGYGETSPVATNETSEGKQKNRRVEFEITNIAERVIIDKE